MGIRDRVRMASNEANPRTMRRISSSTSTAIACGAAGAAIRSAIAGTRSNTPMASQRAKARAKLNTRLLYTTDAADELTPGHLGVVPITTNTNFKKQK